MTAPGFGIASGHDGFVAQRVDVAADDATLYLAYRAGGGWAELPVVSRDAALAASPEYALTGALRLWPPAGEDLGPTDPAEADRLTLLAEAVARYLNTGGSPAGLKAVAGAVARHVPAGLTLPGWRYVGSRINCEGVYEHLFVTPDDPGAAVVWVEGEAVELTTAAALVDEEGWDDAFRNAGWSDPARPDGPAAT